MSQLPLDIEQYIESQLASGAFKTREELLEVAIRLMRQREEDRRFIQREVGRGIEQVELGETISGDEVLERLRVKAEALSSRPGQQ